MAASQRPSRMRQAIRAAAVAASVFAPALASAQNFTCVDTGQTIKAATYLVALAEPSNLNMRTSFDLAGDAMILVGVKRMNLPFYPVVRPGKIQCRTSLPPDAERLYLRISFLRDADAAERTLSALRRGSTRRIGSLLDAWPPFIRFGGEIGFPPNFDPTDPTASKVLLRHYFDRRSGRNSADFLDADVEATVDVGGVSFSTAEPASAEGPEAPPSPPQPEQFMDLRPPLPANPPQRGRPPRPSPSRPHAPAAMQAPPSNVSTASEPVLKKKIVLDFRRKSDWQGVLDGPGVVETFGYCETPVPGANGLYTILCDTSGDGRVPLRIRGFETLLVDGSGSALDDRLKVIGFSTPYPPNWRRPQAELITVAGGSLAQVMSPRIALTQGNDLASCRSEIAAISINDIVKGTLSFPDPPCQPYVVSIPQRLLPSQTVITSNCLPGTDRQFPVGPQGKVTCWLRAGQGGDVDLKVRLDPGFKPVSLSIRRSEAATGTVALDDRSVLNLLEPVWPYTAGILEPGEAPVYVPRSVRYVAANGQPCGSIVGTVSRPNAAIALPTLEAAGCTQLPQRMDVTFEQGVSAPGGPPPETFNRTIEDKVAIVDMLPGQRQIPLASAKQALRVGFSTDDAARYAEEFGSRVGNTIFPGIHVFTGECSATRNGTFVRFGSAGAAQTWPAYAAVYDGRGEEPLTRCAKAEIGRDPQTGAPILTFRLEAARAFGQRRAIVIATSQKFLSGGGSARALSEALNEFAQQLQDAHKRGAPLSPVNVYLVNGGGDYVPLFSGESGAFDLNKVRQAIQTTRETMAPNAPDFGTLDYRPEIRASGLERVMFIMDGSDVEPKNLSTLARFINRLVVGRSGGRNDPNNVVLVTTGSCNQWQAENANFQCRDLPPGFDNRKNLLSDIMAQFITQRGRAPAASPAVEPEPSRPPYLYGTSRQPSGSPPPTDPAPLARDRR